MDFMNIGIVMANVLVKLIMLMVMYKMIILKDILNIIT